MPRPTNKKELLDLGAQNYDKLVKYIENLSAETQNREFPKGTLNRNVRDVLAHLHHWHLLVLGWYEVGMSGAKPQMPAEGYTWKTMPDLNRDINMMYSKMKLDDAKKHLQTSYEQVRLIIKQHTDDALFEKKKYPWIGTTSLAAYLISATSSHYDWGLKLIKKALR